MAISRHADEGVTQKSKKILSEEAITEILDGLERNSRKQFTGVELSSFCLETYIRERKKFNE